MENCTKEVVSLKVVDKKIVEYSEPHRESTSNLMFTGFYWMPITTSRTNYENKTKFAIRVDSIDGYSPTFDVTSHEYEALSICDELKVTIYRSNDLSEFGAIAGKNIVSIRLQE